MQSFGTAYIRCKLSSNLISQAHAGSDFIDSSWCTKVLISTDRDLGVNARLKDESLDFKAKCHAHLISRSIEALCAVALS